MTTFNTETTPSAAPAGDPLLNEALRYFRSQKKPPRVSTIQRAHRVGPIRALNIMRELMAAGHITERATTRGGAYRLVKASKPF